MVMEWLARIAGLRGVMRGLDASDLHADPLEQFRQWYAMARRVKMYQPNAMTLASATSEGQPSSRYVLFKQIDADGVVFYTNYQSRKAVELKANPWASIAVYWRGLERQVRMEGTVGRTSREMSEAYFASRPRGSQLGAWASQQSSPAADRAELNAALERVEAEYAGKVVPCPPHWGGYRVRPVRAEFWQGRAARVHDRFVYTRDENDSWSIQRLHP